MSAHFYQHIRQQLAIAQQEGLFKKNVHIITSAQQAEIDVGHHHAVINFCANNYLGLANHPALIQAAKEEWIRTVLGWHRCALSVARRISTNNWKENWLIFWVWKTPYFTPPASMRMADYLKHCWGLRMPSFLTHLITRRLLMVCVCVKHNATVTPIMT